MNIGGGPGQPSVWAWGCEKNGTLHRPSARRVFAAFEQAISHGSSASVSYINFRLDPIGRKAVSPSLKLQGLIVAAAGQMPFRKNTDRQKSRWNGPATHRQRMGGAASPSVVPATPSTANCSGLPRHRAPFILSPMGTKSTETIYGASVRAAAERATEARKDADRLAVEAWNKRMLGGTAIWK